MTIGNHDIYGDNQSKYLFAAKNHDNILIELDENELSVN